MSTSNINNNNNAGTNLPSWGVSWEEHFKQLHARSPPHMGFLNANAWQRDSIVMRVVGYDGFQVLVVLFLVLLFEALFSFDPSGFNSVRASDAFLVTLVFGAACGVFAIVSAALIKGKLQRLLVRDLASLKVQHRAGQGRRGRLDRLVHEWEIKARDRDFQPACISYEWYNGARQKLPRWVPPALTRPRALAMYGSLSFAFMIVSFGVAVAIRIADSKGMGWSLGFFVLVGGAAILPVVLVVLSSREPRGLSNDEGTPFEGVFF